MNPIDERMHPVRDEPAWSESYYFNFVDPDTKLKDDQGLIFIVGLNWEISKNFMLKAENNYFKGGKDSSLGQFPGRGYNELKTALSLGFPLY